jgi:membrane associated rhomboid family serine protease
MPTCARHPDRPTGLSCARCGRPACSECLHDASVGYQCVDCVRAGRRDTRRATTVAGAELNTRPLVVPLLILVNVAVFAFTVFQAHSLNNNASAPLFYQWALLPEFVAGGEWYRLFTSGFLHYGPIHLLMNMFALWVIGRDMELVLGRLRFSVVYLLSLFGGGLSVFLFGALSTPVAGASGAVFGLMGGIAVAVLRLKLDMRQAFVLIGLNLVISFTIPGISLLGHLGGLVVGALVTLGMVYPPPAKRLAVQVGTVSVLIVAMVALFLLRDAQLGIDHCSMVGGARYLCYRGG